MERCLACCNPHGSVAKIHIVASDFLGDHRKVRRTGTTARAVLTDIRPRYAASVRFSKRVGGGRERGFVARWLGSVQQSGTSA